jgi:hypothetical protein
VESIGLAADNDNTWAFAKLVVCFVFRKMCWVGSYSWNLSGLK